MSNLRMNSFPIRGPELFNCLPADIRDINISQNTFKLKLDNYQALIPDRPRIGEGSKSFHSNKLDTVINHWKWSIESHPRYTSKSVNISGGAATTLVM